MYAKGFQLLNRFFKKHVIFKYGFNYMPMYRRTTGRIHFITEDLYTVQVKIPLSYRNRNYAGSIFGGSLFSATDPIFMVQLINILGTDYIVWDKTAKIKYKRPARQSVFATFRFSQEEIDQIKRDVKENGEIDLIKNLTITDKTGSQVFCELEKTIYVADKTYYKNKRAK